jgi:formylglycine-generating enzyme required for sulfatase activity
MGAHLSNLCLLGLRPVMEGALHALGMSAGATAIEPVTGWLTERFLGHTDRLRRALDDSNARAWKTLEFSLAGDSLWQRCSSMFARADDRAFREQVRKFLDSLPPDALPADVAPDFRRNCLAQLRTARKAGMLDVGALDVRVLARRAGRFAEFADPARMIEAEWAAVAEIADDFPGEQYADLRRLLRLRPSASAENLLSASVRYFFRREVETTPALAASLTFARLEGLAASQRTGFAALEEALRDHADKLERMLDDVLGLVLDLRAEQERQGEQGRQIYDAVLRMEQQLETLSRPMRPGLSLSIRSETERDLARRLLDQFRALPPEQQREMPALINSLGKLQVAAGNAAAAPPLFAQAAAEVCHPSAKAETIFNSYRAALERGDSSAALPLLMEAAGLDPERFAPFRLDKFEPVRILGCGGFGVAFLCINRKTGGRAVVKSLLTDGLERDLSGVLAEARALEELDHPGIIAFRDFDHADRGETRPYLVMNYFEGRTLEELVRESGPLSPAELPGVVRPAAEALAAAHAKGILHRDVKPANILVRRSAEAWQVKLIDFGLAVRATAPGVGGSSAAAGIAGTLDYAAPEQMGRRPGTPVGRYSDVYGFGRTCCFALFGTPLPSRRHWQSVPEALAELLDACIDDDPNRRPADFAAVLARLPGPAAPEGSGARPAVAILPPKAPTTSATAVSASGSSSGAVAAVGSATGTTQAPASRPAVNLFGVSVPIPGAAAPPPSNAKQDRRRDELERQRAETEARRQRSAATVAANSAGMRFALLPAGEFAMGASEGDPDSAPDERPVHRVRITRGFRMAVTPVTQAEFLAVMGRNPGHFNGAQGAFLKRPGGPQHPVENVTWNEAVEFCLRLSEWPAERSAGRRYRLPTEAEWEYACRAGTTTAFHSGPTLPADAARFRSNPLAEAAAQMGFGGILQSTAPVGAHPANGFALHDLHGNVWEWCADWYAPDYYARCPASDPSGPPGGLGRVLRGGSWKDAAAGCRSSARAFAPPERRDPTIGFRVVCVAAG